MNGIREMVTNMVAMNEDATEGGRLKISQFLYLLKDYQKKLS